MKTDFVEDWILDYIIVDIDNDWSKDIITEWYLPWKNSKIFKLYYYDKDKGGYIKSLNWTKWLNVQLYDLNQDWFKDIIIPYWEFKNWKKLYKAFIFMPEEKKYKLVLNSQDLYDYITYTKDYDWNWFSEIILTIILPNWKYKKEIYIYDPDQEKYKPKWEINWDSSVLWKNSNSKTKLWDDWKLIIITKDWKLKYFDNWVEATFTLYNIEDLTDLKI